MEGEDYTYQAKDPGGDVGHVDEVMQSKISSVFEKDIIKPQIASVVPHLS